MKLWFTNKNKHGKVVLNEKTINGLCVCSRIFRLLKQVCGSLPSLMLSRVLCKLFKQLNIAFKAVTGAVATGSLTARVRSSTLGSTFFLFVFQLLYHCLCAPFPCTRW